MKEYKAKQSKFNQHNTSLTGATDANVKWFDQFSNRPGINDVYTEKELGMLKERMLANIKNKINELD